MGPSFARTAMTLELTTSWTVRGHETSAEIAKYRLKGILYWDRQKCPAWRWVEMPRMTITKCGTNFREGWFRLGKPHFRWERRK